jgi:hypothetical protein
MPPLFMPMCFFRLNRFFSFGKRCGLRDDPILRYRVHSEIFLNALHRHSAGFFGLDRFNRSGSCG